MGRNLSPKCKQCRRANDKLLLKGDRCNSPKCAMVKRNYPPGFHGPKGPQRRTDYGSQLNEKQKAKRQYSLLEKQFKLTFTRAKGKTGNTGENFIKILESRLDNAIYRIGFAASRVQARQLVNHGHFTVNDKKVSIPSFQIKTGDIIKIKSNKKRSKLFKDLSENISKKDIPGWLNLDAKEMSVKVLHSPKFDDINVNFNIQMIVEYYSR